MIGIARLRTGFIGFLVALSSLDYHKLFHHKTFSHQKWVFHVYAKNFEGVWRAQCPVLYFLSFYLPL